MKDKGPSQRTIELTQARVAGYCGDRAEFTRLIIGRRVVSAEDLNQAFRAGEARKAADKAAARDGLLAIFENPPEPNPVACTVETPAEARRRMARAARARRSV